MPLGPSPRPLMVTARHVGALEGLGTVSMAFHTFGLAHVPLHWADEPLWPLQGLLGTELSLPLSHQTFSLF